MKQPSRWDALKIRFALIVAGIGLGLAARWVMGVDRAEEAPLFKPIPQEFIDQHSGQSFFKSIDQLIQYDE